MPIPGNKILDVLISMALIYALLSLLVSILLEWWNYFKKTRAMQLKTNISRLLNDSMNLQFGELFYSHFLISGIHNKEEKHPPQYISSRLFADVLIDIIGHGSKHDQPVQLIGMSVSQGKQYTLGEKLRTLSTIEQFKNGLDRLNPSPLVDTLQSFLSKSEGDIEKLKKSLSSWFDDYMDRASGWYKSQQRNKLYVFGFLVAIALNVDSLHLVKMISLDDALRNNLVMSADKLTEQYNHLSDSARQKTSELEALVVKNFPSHKLRDENGELLTKLIKDSIAKKIKDSKAKKIKDPSAAAKIDSLQNLLLADTTSRIYQQRAERIINVAASLNIPMGWEEHSAPLSWKKKKPAVDQVKSVKIEKAVKIKYHDHLIEYLDKRNQWSFWNGVKYFLGILISGFSLSFGAPFWFDTLMRLVNIRRAGKKPEATNVK